MGGGGYCISRGLARKLGALDLVAECEAMQQPDDMTIGLLMERIGETR